jgi:sugar lactone lactonase YvrE
MNLHILRFTALVYLYTSTLLIAQDPPGTITTVAYSGSKLTLLPGVRDQASGAIAVDVSGNLYVVGMNLKYDPAGHSTAFLGTWSDRTWDFADGQMAVTYGFARTMGALDNGPSFSLTPGIVVDLKGVIYLAAPGDHRVRRIDPSGILRTTAGSSVREWPRGPTGSDQVLGGFNGDAGLATQAALYKPADVAFDAQGNLYIADCGNGRIRVVNREGFIYTFAGRAGGSSVSAGDGGQASDAVLVSPVSVAADLEGNVYVADFYDHRVRRIAADEAHTITTFAGTGVAGYSGDGGPATQAQLQFPSSVATDVKGNVFIADRENHRVRMVDSKGIITTYAGTGFLWGELGDGGPALQARLTRPRDLAIDAKGYVYISHDDELGTTAGAYGWVRRVSPAKEYEVPSVRLSATVLNFDAKQINTAVEQILTVSNPAKETPLLVELMVEDNPPEFKLIPTNFLVSAGGSQKVQVRFTPSMLRATWATMRVYHSGVEENPLRVTLNFEGSIKSADFDRDGKVGLEDFFLFAGAFGREGIGDNAAYDLDGSGRIDFDDFFLFAARFGK